MATKISVVDKWDDPWFRRLKPEEKLMFIYLCEQCDCAGFWEFDDYGASFQTRIPEEKIGEIIETLCSPYEGSYKAHRGGKWIWLKNHIKHQQNMPLCPNNNCHKGIVKRLLDHTDMEEVSIFINENITIDESGSWVTLGRVTSKSNSKSKSKGKEGECEREVLTEGDLPLPAGGWLEKFRGVHPECATVSSMAFVSALRAACVYDQPEVVELSLDAFERHCASISSFRPQTALGKFENYLRKAKTDSATTSARVDRPRRVYSGVPSV